MRPSRWCALLVAALALVAGCTTGTDPTPGATPPAKGPLAVGRLAGDTQILAPTIGDWWAGFGSFVPCTTHTRGHVVIQGVRTASDLTPKSVQVFRRQVTPDLVRRTPPAERSALGPRFTYLGHPPGFTEPYAEDKPGGGWVLGVRGAEVSTTCAEVERAEDAVSGGRVPRTGFEELVFELSVDRSGARLTDAWIDYLVDDKPGTLHLSWVMVACGDRFTDPDQCRLPPPTKDPVS